MSDLSVEVERDEVDGDLLPFKTSGKVLALLELDARDTVDLDLVFPIHSGTQIGEEGILGWYRPQDYSAKGKGSLGFSKILFLQETLRDKARYLAATKNELSTYRIVLNCKKIGGLHK